MLSFKEESEISLCAPSMDRVMPAGLVEKSTATVRKSVGLAKSLKSVLYFFTVLGLTLSLPAVVFAQVQKTAPLGEANVEEKASYLFVLRADTGVITKTNGGYKLTLKGMDDKVLYFSDRDRVRKAGYLPTTQFMGNWAKGNESKEQIRQMAAIVHADLKTNANGKSQTINVELLKPERTEQGWSFDLSGGDGVEEGRGRLVDINIFIDTEPRPWPHWKAQPGGHDEVDMIDFVQLGEDESGGGTWQVREKTLD